MKDDEILLLKLMKLEGIQLLTFTGQDLFFQSLFFFFKKVSILQLECSMPFQYFRNYKHFVYLYRDSIEDFSGYDYPKPAIPFPPPTSDSDAEDLPARTSTGSPARLING